MADDGSAQGKVWPLPKFFFLVESDSLGTCSFQEVSGLDNEEQTPEYRHGDSPIFSHVKTPGIKSHTVTLKKGIFAGDHATFLDWFSQIKMNVIQRETLTITLLDEEGAPTMIWTLNNAFPLKVTGTDLKSDGNEVAIETIEFAYEDLTINNP